MTGSPRSGMRLIDFRPSAHGTRIGFAEVELSIGLQIAGISLHRGPNGVPYALLPSAPEIGPDGVQKRDPSGNRMWRPILQWAGKIRQHDWSARLIVLVRQHHPEAFGPREARR